MRLAVIIINYCTAELVLECLASVVPQVEPVGGCVVIVDNASGDGSIDRIDAGVAGRGWSRAVRIVRSPRNGGFSCGNNVGIGSVEAESYLLLNSDTIVRPGAIESLLAALEANPQAGAIGPRLEWPDATPQASAFHFRTPRTELMRAAATGLVTRLAGGREVAIEPEDQPLEPEWLSFACVLLRGEAVRQIGSMDEGYFMYFEDIDYCRRLADAGWRRLYWPQARVVHLRGGSSTVKSDASAKRRLPRYYYESRSRYFAKFHGAHGLWLANVLWVAGWSIAQVRRALGRRTDHLCRGEWVDNWINAWRPLTCGAASGDRRHAAA